MSLTVSAAIHQAQQSLDRGEYPQAAMLCDRLVTQFPGYARAWTLLGEAFREQGQNADAQRAYQAAIKRELRSPLAFQGLGLLAEEQGNVDGALAYCQVGWELSPADQGMREPLMRVAMRRFATDGELQYTLPALAQQHLRSSRLRRALRTWRAAHAQLPERADVEAGMALTLWRLGHDSAAATHCERLLERYPESAESLTILADISERAGEQQRARELVERLRAVDPDGSIAARLCALHPGANAALLQVADERLPLVDESIHGTVAERPRLAPAPDVDYIPARADAELAHLESLRLGNYSGNADALPEPVFDPFAGALGVDRASAPQQAASMAAVDDPTLPAGLEPMSLAEFGAQPGEELPTFAPEHVLAAEDMEAGIGDAGAWGTPTPSMQAAAPEAAAADDWQATPVRPFESYSEQSDDDLFGDLAAELRGEVGDALTRSGQAEQADDHRPPMDDPRGFTTVLRSLDDEGIAPFDPRSRAPIADMPSMLMNDDEISNAIPSGEPATDRLGEISHDWESIDAEIQAAMPAGYAPGYTDELRALDQIGLMPFEVELGDPTLGEDAPDAPRTLDDILLQERGAPVAQDAEPAATPAPADTDAPSAPEVAATAAEAISAGQAHGYAEFEDLLGGLQPFAAEEFDQDVPPPVSPTQSFSFSQGAWDAAIGGSSAVPSDADLEALLSDDGDLDANTGVSAGFEPSASAEAATDPDNADDEFDFPRASLTNDLMQRPVTSPLDPRVAAELDSEWEASGISMDVAAAAAGLGGEQADEGEYIDRDPSGTEQLAAELDLLEALEREEAERGAESRSEQPFADAFASTQTQDDATPFSFDLQEATATDLDAALLQDDIVTAELGTGLPIDPGPEMLERARDAKQSLIDTGVISGVREFDDFQIDAPTVMLGQQALEDAHRPVEADVPSASDSDAEQDLEQGGMFSPQADDSMEALLSDAVFADEPGVQEQEQQAQQAPAEQDAAQDDTSSLADELARFEAEPTMEPMATPASSPFAYLQPQSDEDTAELPIQQPANRTAAPESVSADEPVQEADMAAVAHVAPEQEPEAAAEYTPLAEAAAEPIPAAPTTSVFADFDLALDADDDDSDDAQPVFAPVDDTDDDDDVDIIHGIGATRDTATLRAALSITPDDAELHWWLAEALRERGEVLPAIDEYRWLIRNAPERQDAVLAALLTCLERQQEPERVHRLLGDLFRRRGDSVRASHHASQALLARRRAQQAAAR